jgi:hypothetical protein
MKDVLTTKVDAAGNQIGQARRGNRDEFDLPTADFELHPLALLPPPMPDARYRELVEDIKAQGQLVAVTTLDGKVLDGRHRGSACKELGICIRAKRLAPGIDPLDYVISKNLRRRQLSAGQRAAFAAKLMPLYAAEAAKRKQALSGTRANPDGSKPEVAEILPEPDACGEAREKAAKATGASARYVSDALKLQREADELFRAVDSGKMSIPKALRELGAQRDERTAPGTALTQSDLMIVLREDSDAPSSRASEKKYGAKTYPNLAVFRFHDTGDIKIESVTKRGFSHVALFVVPVESNLTIKATDGKSFCKPSCRFLSLSVRGTVPEPATLPDQIIHGGYEGVIKLIESMYPDARRAVDTSHEKVPQGWDHVPQDSRAAGSTKASGASSDSNQPDAPVADVSNLPTSTASSPITANKTPAKIVKPRTQRKTKLTTVGDHLSKLRDEFDSIIAELHQCQQNTPEIVRRADRYIARGNAIPSLKTVTEQLAQIVDSLGAAGDLPFSTKIAPRGSRSKRLQRMIEIVAAVVKVLQGPSPKIAEKLQISGAELGRIRSRGGL